jgi:hypothetical protein
MDGEKCPKVKLNNVMVIKRDSIKADLIKAYYCYSQMYNYVALNNLYLI